MLLLNNFKSWLSKSELERCRVQHASYVLLSAVSDTMQSHFLPLINSPLLIVESLLMNARVDLLAPFLQEFPEIRLLEKGDAWLGFRLVEEEKEE